MVEGKLSCMASVVTSSVKTEWSGYDLRRNLPSIIRCRRHVVDMRRCFLAKLVWEIREFHDLQTHRSWKRSFTGSLHKISSMRSNGRMGSESSSEDNDGDGDGDGGDVRVSCLFMAVDVSSTGREWAADVRFRVILALVNNNSLPYL